MQEQHGRHIRNLQGIHNQELEAKDKEISRLNAILEKALKWFPMLREMLRMEKLCAAIGFTKEMIESLLTKKEAIRCNGRIYSEEHRRSLISRMMFSGGKESADDEKLVLTINKQPIGRMVQGAIRQTPTIITSAYTAEKEPRNETINNNGDRIISMKVAVFFILLTIC